MCRSFEEVKDYLQEYLRQVEQNQILGKDDKSELYVLFVSCLEVGSLAPLPFPGVGGDILAFRSPM